MNVPHPIGDIVSPRDSGLRRWMRRILHALERGAEARRIRATAVELAKLDDATLRDIGLARGNIEGALRDRAEQERRQRFGW